MMPLSLILWLLMQGQTDASGCNPIPASLCYYAGCEDAAIEVDGGCPVYATPISDAQPASAPVEHVIEIRTRRVLTGKTKMCYLIVISEAKGPSCEIVDKVKECPQGTECSDDYTVTKEVYVDGSRVGTLKETEAK